MDESYIHPIRDKYLNQILLTPLNIIIVIFRKNEKLKTIVDFDDFCIDFIFVKLITDIARGVEPISTMK